jgi:hypothetical protein
MPRVALARCPQRSRDRDGKGEERGKSRQPLLLFVHLPSGTFDAGESHGQVGAYPIDRVVGPSGVDRLDGKVCPLRKLRREQPAHERDVDVHLVDMHFASGHEHLTLSVSWRVF